jgi:hypothetical protein
MFDDSSEASKGKAGGGSFTDGDFSEDSED